MSTIKLVGGETEADCPVVLLTVSPPIVQHERMKFLVIGTKTGVEVYAWAQKPYSKFMAFKVHCLLAIEAGYVFTSPSHPPSSHSLISSTNLFWWTWCVRVPAELRSSMHPCQVSDWAYQ